MNINILLFPWSVSQNSADTHLQGRNFLSVIFAVFTHSLVHIQARIDDLYIYCSFTVNLKARMIKCEIVSSPRKKITFFYLHNSSGNPSNSFLAYPTKQKRTKQSETLLEATVLLLVSTQAVKTQVFSLFFRGRGIRLRGSSSKRRRRNIPSLRR